MLNNEDNLTYSQNEVKSLTALRKELVTQKLSNETQPQNRIYCITLTTISNSCASELNTSKINYYRSCNKERHLTN